MFKNEFRSLQDVQHPNLVELGELFEDDGTWFFRMERVQGVSLLTYVGPGDAEPLDATASLPAPPTLTVPTAALSTGPSAVPGATLDA